MVRRPPAFLLLILLALLTACGGSGNAVKVAPTRTPAAVGSPRGYLMGFSSLPYAQGDEAYRASFKFLGDSGEVALIQRAPPWTDFLPGAVISERTENLDRAARNLPWLSVETPTHASVYQILRNDRVLFEKAALLSLQEALA